MDIGTYRGEIAPGYQRPGFTKCLARLPELLRGEGSEILSEGRHRIVRLQLAADDLAVDLVVKAFGRQTWIKDAVDVRRGSKARRTWLAASHLASRGVGTPEPVACLERRAGGRLPESYYLSRFVPDVVSFQDELVRLFHDEPICEHFMDLMQAVAVAVRGMHEAGFQHRDLGNQNILLRRTGEAAWGDVQFVDLNRGRILPALSLRRRARDLCRLHLPSDLLRVFKEMYFGDVVPEAFHNWERIFRSAYALHARTRALRHPVRRARQRRRDRGKRTYPAEKDLWIWDSRSVQAISTMMRRDRHRHYPPFRHARIALAAARQAVPVWREYGRLKEACYASPVELAGRIGMAVSPKPATWDRERGLLDELGNVPVMVRFYHHETMADWDYVAQVVCAMAEGGRSVSVALVQDRNAVREPGRWAAFATRVLGQVGEHVEFVEVGHAINRVKWGIWDYGEYGALLKAMAAVSDWHPRVRYTGPAVIDFEYADVLAALAQVPADMRFSALSHHLYVDRRGAPENRQGRFGALEKFALARAVAATSPACDDRLVVSEVNWPIVGTGVYSPVGSPYVSPGPRYNDPSVSEDAYADYMLRYLLIALCSGMVDRVYWWRLVARGFGLVDDSDPAAWRKRPAYQALKIFLRHLGEARFVEKAAVTDGSERFVFEQAGGERVTLVYTAGERPVTISPKGATAATDALGGPVDVTGPIRVGGRPVYLWEGEPRPVGTDRIPGR